MIKIDELTLTPEEIKFIKEKRLKLKNKETKLKNREYIGIKTKEELIAYALYVLKVILAMFIAGSGIIEFVIQRM